MRLDLWQFCMVAETAMRSRYDLSEPFSRGAYSYATDGKILVRVPRVCEDREATWPQIEMITSAISLENLSPIHEIETPDQIECPVCKGFGVVRPCGVCNEGCKRCAKGFGYIPARKPHPDQETCDHCEGRKTVYPEGAYVYLTPRLAIDPRYYRMLASLPGVRVDLTKDGICRDGRTQPQDGISFAFDGGDGMLMPIRIYSPQFAVNGWKRDRVLAEWKAGSTLRDLAAKYEISREAVRAWTDGLSRKVGASRRPKNRK